MSVNEGELLRELAYDALVRKCTRGESSWAEFESSYNCFYPRYALDGHASDAEERRLFEKHAARIVLHREIWEQVLTKVTADEHLRQQASVDAGLCGPREAVRRLQELVRQHLVD